MIPTQSRNFLKIFLVCYGSENESWVCDGEDRDHAVEQFESAGLDGEINEVFECIPATNRYFVRQRLDGIVQIVSVHGVALAET